MTESPVDKGVVTVPLKSWKDYSDFIMKNLSNAPAYMFRGQANNEWNIESTLDRLERKFPTYPNFHWTVPDEFGCCPLSRDRHFKAFKEAARGKLGNILGNLSINEWWGLAQHHGLSTPMLDWTYSPFIALYFAFEEDGFKNDKNWSTPHKRVVLALSSHLITEKDSIDGPSPKPFSPGAHIGYRIGNQAGLFLKMPEQCELESYIQGHFPEETTDGPHRGREILYKIHIPNEGRKECLKFLNKMNINRLSLFPDLDGASRFINNLWEIDGDSLIGHIPSEIE